MTPQPAAPADLSDHPAGRRQRNVCARACRGTRRRRCRRRAAAPADSDERTLVNRAKAIAAVVQRRDIALLLDGRPDIAIRAGADGAHLTGIAALTAALGALKPDRIAGAGGLRSRHDAMLAAEAGADYVMFGEPDRDNLRSAFDAVLERIAWWAELFQLPCVGYAANLDEVGAIAQAGADFIALGDWIWTDAPAD